MSRILVVGWELPDHSASDRMEAANYRTWQLVEALLADGHELYLIAGRVGADYPAEPPAPSTSGALTYVPFKFSRPGWMRLLQKTHDAFRPDCMVGVTFLGSLRATRLKTQAPLWVDIYGDQMAEMQAKAHRVQSDRGIATQLRFLRQVLLAGDVFSTCSAAQRYALLGQLSMVGRLSRATFGYEFAYVIPPGAGQAKAVKTGALRGKGLNATDRVALWCGGYNTWTDVDTLYRGLDLAMASDPSLRFVSVGGAAAGAESYTQFVEMVEQSRHSDRFHMLGWLPVSQVPGYYAEADIGISLDTACYEAELGTRTRLVEMMAYGLPIVTTLACELSSIIHDEGLGLTFDIGDWQAMGQQVLTLCQDDERRRQMGERARAYATTTLSLKSSTAALRSWVWRPQRAPDRRSETRGKVWAWQYSVRALARQTLWSLAGLDQ